MTITFNGKDYPVAEVYVEDFGMRLIATESLDYALSEHYKKTRYPNIHKQALLRRNATLIDEHIFFFVPDDMINLPVDELGKYVSQQSF